MKATWSMGMVSVLGLMGACGAPVKKASDVSSLFYKDTMSLQGKVDGLCSDLAARQEAPSTKVFSEGSLDCGNAGANAQNYNGLERFSFVGVDSNFRPAKRDGDVSFIEVRSEVWLNQNLLNLASKVGDVMKRGLDTGNVSFASDPNDKLAGLVTPKVEVLEKAQFNQKTLEFSMKIHFTLDGVVKADHVIDVRGKIMDNVIAVSAVTTEDQEFKKSVLKNFQAMFLIVPHASDVYLDLNVKMNVHDLGVGSELVKDNVHKALSSGMKAAIDSLLGLK